MASNLHPLPLTDADRFLIRKALALAEAADQAEADRMRRGGHPAASRETIHARYRAVISKMQPTGLRGSDPEAIQ